MGKPYRRSSDGMWCQAIELPSYGGKRRRKVIARREKADLAAAVRAARRELARTGDLPTGSPTLARWLEQWLTRAERDDLKPRTAATYRAYIDRYIVPAIGRTRLDRLTPTHVERLHEAILDAGLSSTTALQAHRILARALTVAERRGLVQRNVARLVDAPTRAYAPRPVLTVEQARSLLLRSAEGDPQQATMWAVALLAGLRQGERLGLTVGAVDLDRAVLTVEWQLQRLPWRHGCGRRAGSGAPWPCGHGRGGSCPDRHVIIPPDQEARRVHGGLWLTRPKSRAGWREVPICEPLRVILTRYMETHDPGDEGLVFHRRDGHPIDPADDLAAWYATLAAAGLPRVVGHSLRHTANTLLYALGVPVETREAIMGHSSAEVNRAYTHAATADTAAAMARLGELVAGAVPA